MIETMISGVLCSETSESLETNERKPKDEDRPGVNSGETLTNGHHCILKEG